jgi:hypothetical protein
MAQKVVVGHETELRPPLPGSMGSPADAVHVPDKSIVRVKTLPSLLTATQRLAVGHETDIKAQPSESMGLPDMGDAVHVFPGSVRMKALPL